MLCSLVGWVAADVRFAAFILKVDLGLIQRRTKQVITDNSSLTLSSRFANRQPVEPQRIALNDPVLRIERPKLVQRELLAAIQQVALILGDDKGAPGNLGGEVATLDTPDGGSRNIQLPLFPPATPVNCGH